MDEVDVYKTPRLKSDDIIIFKYPEYKNMDDEARCDFWENLSEHEKYVINQITTIANGYGKFSLFVNEASRSQCGVSKYSNLLDWDIDCWNLQRKWRLDDEHDPHDIGEYSFDKGMKGEWIRFIEDSRLVYGTFYSLASYLWWKMEDLVYDIGNEIIPHTYEWNLDPTEGPKNKSEYREVHIVLNANGKEKEYEVLQKLTYSFIAEDEGIGNKLISNMIKRFKGTFRVNFFENPNDPYSDLIVCDQETLRKIRPENFLSDFTRFQNELSLLDDLVKDFTEKVSSEFLEFIKNA